MDSKAAVVGGCFPRAAVVFAAFWPPFLA